MTSHPATPLPTPLENGTTTNGSGPGSSTDESGKGWERVKRIGMIVGGLAAVVTAGTAVWGIINTIGLQRDGNGLERAAQNAHLEEMMMNVDRHFVRYPQLRPFFYESAGYPGQKGKLQNQAFATAELIIDYADDIAAYVRVGKMDRRDHKRWSEMMWGYFQDSAVTRRQWKRFSGSYDQFTACVLGAPIGDDLTHWDWKPRPQQRFDPKC